MLLSKKFFLALIVIGVILVLFLIYHNLSKPLSEEKFVKIYVELTLLQTEPPSDQKLFLKKKKEILNKYKVEQKDIDYFIEEYKKDPEKWISVWKKINKRLEQRVKSR